MTLNSKISISLLLLVVSLIFGLILTKLGKPYNTGLFTIHKIVALGFVIFTGLMVKTYIQVEGLSLLLVIALILLIVGIIGLFSTGAMMSIGVGHHEVLRLIHIITMSGLTIGFVLLVLRVKS